MCGFALFCSLRAFPNPNEDLVELLRRRGPDDLRVLRRNLSATDCVLRDGPQQTLFFTLVASVLWLRGESIVSQPLLDEVTESFLVWNGEAWRVDGKVITGSDSAFIFRSLLLSCTKKLRDSSDESPKEVLIAQAINEVLESICGPFSFIFYEGCTQRIFYGRDVLGRRSLLKLQNEDGTFQLSSVSPGLASGMWTEVETGGIFLLKLSLGNILERPSSGERVHPGFETRFFPWVSKRYYLPPLNRDLGFPSTSDSLPSPENLAKLESLLCHALLPRLKDPLSPHVQAQCGKPVGILFSGGVDCTLLALLVDKMIPPDNRIDLLNVAFENPRVAAAATARHPGKSGYNHAKQVYAMCPDRKTGLYSHSQLQELRPLRQWRFVAIDIPYNETIAHRKAICDLMYPHRTQMDLSISLALYFAGRGSGDIIEAGHNHQYTTPTRVLLSGLGADELFGGYARHARAYNSRGYQGLLDELDLDINRLSSRNLGRDDRIISHWGREVRYPYLDEDLVRWAVELPIREKCGFGTNMNADSGKKTSLGPDKLILRLLAQHLGLGQTAHEKKRAIQFGARTARMDESRQSGADLV